MQAIILYKALNILEGYADDGILGITVEGFQDMISLTPKSEDDIVISQAEYDRIENLGLDTDTIVSIAADPVVDEDGDETDEYILYGLDIEVR